jgi:hypothetical protein
MTTIFINTQRTRLGTRRARVKLMNTKTRVGVFAAILSAFIGGARTDGDRSPNSDGVSARDQYVANHLCIF